MKKISVNRDISIDIIKFLAMIGVVMIHSCSFDVPIASPDWCFSLFYRSLTAASVPLFLMASGAVMLNSEKEVPLKKLYFKNMLRLFIAMMVWGVAYKIYHLYDENLMSSQNMIKAVKEVFFFNQEFHFYYIHMMFIVYMFLPVTRSFVNSASKNTVAYFLVLWFLFGCVYPSMMGTPLLNSYSGMVTQYGINMTYASIGYGVLGYYLRKYPLNKLTSLVLILAGISAIFATTYINSVKYGVLYERSFEGVNIYVCTLAIGVFSLFAGADLKKRPARAVVVWGSKASFGIYLVHMLVMHLSKDAGLSVGMASYIISVPLFAFTILAISALVYFILSIIPVLKKWIV